MVKKKSKERRKCRVNSHGVPMMMSVKQHSAIYRVHGGPSVWSACFMCFRAFYDQIICENHTTPKSYPFIQKFWYFQYCFSEKSGKSIMILYKWLQKTYAFERRFCWLFPNSECFYSNMKVRIGRASSKDIFVQHN